MALTGKEHNGMERVYKNNCANLMPRGSTSSWEHPNMALREALSKASIYNIAWINSISLPTADPESKLLPFY